MGTRKFIALLMLITILTSTGCEEAEESIVQPNFPDANGSILEQYLIGNREDDSWVKFMQVGDDGTIFFYGAINGSWYISRLDPDGRISWKQDPEMDVREICLVTPPFGGGEKVLLATGGVDTDGDEKSEHAMISLYEQDGTIIVRQQFQNNEYDIWFNNIELILSAPGEGSFFFSGGARGEGVGYPYCGYGRIGDDRSVSLGEDTIMTGYADKYFDEVAWNRNQASPLFFVILDQYITEDEVENELVICVDDTLGVIWEKNVIPEGAFEGEFYQIRYENGSAYVAGLVRVKKQGRHWSAGLMSSVSETGDLNWAKSVSLSDYGDAYFDCIIDQDALYAVGHYSYLRWPTTMRLHGYALLSKFSLPTGEVRFHRSFGGSRYASNFLGLHVNAGSIICGGWSNYYISGYWSQGWIVKIDTGQLRPGMEIASAKGIEYDQESIEPATIGWARD